MLSKNTFEIEKPLMQQIISVLAALPWGQIDGVMQPLQATLRAQELAQSQPQEQQQPATPQ